MWTQCEGGTTLQITSRIREASFRAFRDGVQKKIVAHDVDAKAAYHLKGESGGAYPLEAVVKCGGSVRGEQPLKYHQEHAKRVLEHSEEVCQKTSSTMQ